jgi:WRKY transcription factor 22
LKACVARKLVERNPDRPDVLVVTYIGEHCHAVPTMLSSLAGNTTRNSRPEASTTDDQSDKQREESAEASSMTVDGGSAETPPDDDNALWPVLDMSPLDEYDYSLVDGFLVGPPFDDDVDLYLEDDDGLGMMSL